MEIISKRHPYKFYLTLILVNAFFLILCLIFILFFNDDTKFIIGSLILLAIVISINVGFIKNAPSIILDEEGITFKNNLYFWFDLSNVKLTGKGVMPFTSGECATLIFKDVEKIQIFDDFYSNISEMKCFIQEIVNDKKEEIGITKEEIKPIGIDQELFIPYKGNPVFSFRGFLIWGIILFIVLLPICTNRAIHPKGISLIFLFSLFCIFVNSWSMYYFEVSKNFFIIRNHCYFWKKETYPISKIKEIVFENNYKLPYRLRIITTDFKTKSYFAAV